MVDRKNDSESGEEVKMQPWPSRVVVSPLENALHHWLDWGDISRLRGEYDFPYQVAQLDAEELAKKFSRESDLEKFKEAQSVIKIWNSDPEGFKNPYDGGESIPQRVKPNVQVKREVLVEVKER